MLDNLYDMAIAGDGLLSLIFEDDAAFGLVIGSKSGEQIVKASAVMDATENALLWR